jgi:hypothetical protein
MILNVQIRNQVGVAIHWFQQPYLHLKVSLMAIVSPSTQHCLYLSCEYICSYTGWSECVLYKLTIFDHALLCYKDLHGINLHCRSNACMVKNCKFNLN